MSRPVVTPADKASREAPKPSSLNVDDDDHQSLLNSQSQPTSEQLQLENAAASGSSEIQNAPLFDKFLFDSIKGIETECTLEIKQSLGSAGFKYVEALRGNGITISTFLAKKKEFIAQYATHHQVYPTSADKQYSRMCLAIETVVKTAIAEVKIEYQRNMIGIKRLLERDDYWNQETKEKVQHNQLKYALLYEIFRSPAASKIITWAYCHEDVDTEENYKLKPSFPTKDEFLSEVMGTNTAKALKQYASRNWSSFSDDDDYDWPPQNIFPLLSSSEPLEALASSVVPKTQTPVAKAARRGAASAEFEGAAPEEEEDKEADSQQSSKSWLVDDPGDDADGEEEEEHLLLSSDEDGAKKKRRSSKTTQKEKNNKKAENNQKFEVNGSAVGLSRITWAWFLVQDETTKQKVWEAAAEDLMAKARAGFLLPKCVYLVTSISIWEKAANGFTTVRDGVVEDMIDNTAIFKQGRV